MLGKCAVWIGWLETSPWGSMVFLEKKMALNSKVLDEQPVCSGMGSACIATTLMISDGFQMCI